MNHHAVTSIRSRAALVTLCVALASCGRAEVQTPVTEATIVGTDYAFDAPDVMSAGRTAFAFENRGAVPHEMILVRLKEGMTIRQVLDGMQQGASPEEFVDGGANILIAAPGESASGRILIDLERDRHYALVCNFRDSADAPPHTALGMFKGIAVQ